MGTAGPRAGPESSCALPNAGQPSAPSPRLKKAASFVLLSSFLPPGKLHFGQGWGVFNPATFSAPREALHAFSEPADWLQGSSGALAVV